MEVYLQLVRDIFFFLYIFWDLADVAKLELKEPQVKIGSSVRDARFGEVLHKLADCIWPYVEVYSGNTSILRKAFAYCRKSQISEPIMSEDLKSNVKQKKIQIRLKYSCTDSTSCIL